jgi:glycosyltransferase involved in cell wall biosynthesis
VPPRLIELADYIPVHAGSFIPFLTGVLAESRRRGWAAELVLPEPARERDWIAELEGSGATIHFRSGSRRDSAGWLAELLAQSDEPTLLHTHFTSYDLAAVAAARRRPGTTVYWHVHTVLSNTLRARLANMAKFATAGRKVERILCPSQNIADGVSRRLGPSDRIEVFPSPIDVASFPDMSAKRAEARRAFGIPEDAEVLLTFGRDWRIKGGDVFVATLRRLRDEGRDVFGVIGQGKAEAEAAIEKEGVGEYTAIVGAVPDVRELLAVADVFVAPSRGEGMPFSVIEALCTGIPVVASDLPGHRFVADHVDACTIAPRESGPVATQVAAFLDAPPGEVHSQCAAAREWIDENLDLSAAIGKLADYYETSFAALSGGTEV